MGTAFTVVVVMDGQDAVMTVTLGLVVTITRVTGPQAVALYNAWN